MAASLRDSTAAALGEEQVGSGITCRRQGKSPGRRGRNRIFIATLLGLISATISFIGVASPVDAATRSAACSAFDATGPNTTAEMGDNAGSFGNFAVGEEVGVIVSNLIYGSTSASLEVPWGSTVASGVGTLSYVIPSTGFATWRVSVNNFPGGGATFDFFCNPVPDPQPSASISLPESIVQQFGKPTSNTCDADASDSMNWSGVASGGWGESWAAWMNGGTGGFVCTRTLHYSTTQSKWVVN